MSASSLTVVLALSAWGLGAPLQSPTSSRGAGDRPVELTAEAGGEEPEVLISPGKSTTLTFDTELRREADGGKAVELEKREAFQLVDAGDTVLRLIPSDMLKPGERVRLKVRFQERAAPAGAAFTLVVHATRAEPVVEVYRNARPVESYQQEAREARAEAAQCQAELEAARAESTGPGGLRGLIAEKLLDERGVNPKNLLEEVTKPPGNALNVHKVLSYRTAGRVAVELEVELPADAQPFTVAGAALTGRRGAELKVLPVWPSGPITTNPGDPGRVAVEAEVTGDEARGVYTLKLWEAGTGRTVIVGNVTFPQGARP